MMRSDMLILAQSSIPPNIGVSLGSGRRFPISSRYHSHSLFSKSRSNPRNKGLFWQRHPIEFFPETGNLNYSDPNLPFRRVNDWVGVSTASMGVNSGSEMARKRNVVEHICLVITKAELSDEEEKDMLDYLYTTQYQMGGIVGMSLGRISVQNAENYTHAIYMRFQSKEDLMKFYENPFFLRVMEQHVMPYCHGLMNMDFESEVEDDILSIFRKGEEFNYGVEFMLLIAFMENTLGGSIEDALASLAKLTVKFPSLIVQSTQGSNINLSNKEYTHGVVIRFRSLQAFEIFMGTSDYKDVWSSKFQMITKKSLSIHFSVDPVGTEIM